jgi:DNA-binding NtrC family response regulator
MMSKKILVVDDRLDSLWKCADVFQDRGFCVVTCSQSDKALDIFAREEPDVVLLDIKMPGKNGFDLLKEIRKNDKRVCVIMLSAYGDAQTVVSAMKMGADNFADKGSDPEKLVIVIEKELSRKAMAMEILSLKAEMGIELASADQIIGESEAIRSVRAQILEYADTDDPVLITGQSGVGKDLAAGAIHYESGRRHRPFKHLLCPGIQETLFESELFGHERGSFTSAHRSTKGVIEAAGGGTVFLNEVADMPASAQAKLLLVIETGVFMKVGGEGRMFKSDARFIAATNTDIQKALQTRRLREDLFFRLNQAWINIPPLKERGDDVAILAEHFINTEAHRRGRPTVKLSSKSVDLLLNYDWPGNVRELKGIMARVVSAGSDDVIKGDALLGKHRQCCVNGSRTGSRLKDATTAEAEAVEERMITNALQRFGGHRKKAAQWLGISYRSLMSKMKKYGLRETF